MKVYIYCGVPGSGKSTLIKERHPGAVVCSADDFFTDPDTGEYKFDPSKLPAAHAECLRKFNQLVTAYEGDWPGTLVVDNTNTTVAEIAPYAALALAYGHELTVVTVECDPDVAAARNTHGVSVEACWNMNIRLHDREMPPWWKQETVISQGLAHPDYITITKGLRGFFAVWLTWNPDHGGFYKPEAFGIGSYESVDAAEPEAKDWAESRRLEYRRPT